MSYTNTPRDSARHTRVDYYLIAFFIIITLWERVVVIASLSTQRTEDVLLSDNSDLDRIQPLAVSLLSLAPRTCSVHSRQT